MSQTDPGTLMERLRDGFRRLTENRMNLILICAVTGIILIAASYIWDEQAEPAESVSDAGTLLSADTRTLEQRLSEMVSRIDGAGRSCVMVTMDSTREAVYAQDLRETEDTSSSSESASTEPFLTRMFEVRRSSFCWMEACPFGSICAFQMACREWTPCIRASVAKSPTSRPTRWKLS